MNVWRLNRGYRASHGSLAPNDPAHRGIMPQPLGIVHILDIRKLMHIIHERRPDLVIPKNWI